MPEADHAEVQVILPSQVVTVCGSPADSYFSTAQQQANGLESLSKFIQQSLPYNAKVADVGANIGITTLIMAKLLPFGEIFAFEPSPKTASFLRENVRRSGLNIVTVIEAAVGAKSGSLSFSHIDHFSAGSHVSQVGDVGVEVEACRLDAFCAEKGLRLDFVKIDAEGYEPWVLSGCEGIVRPDLPIWMEFNSLCLTNCGGNSMAFAKSLVETFDIQRVESNGLLLPVLNAQTFAHENMVTRGCVDDILLLMRANRSIPSLSVMTGQTLNLG